jgi:hypothetical protein
MTIGPTIGGDGFDEMGVVKAMLASCCELRRFGVRHDEGVLIDYDDRQKLLWRSV